MGGFFVALQAACVCLALSASVHCSASAVDADSAGSRLDRQRWLYPQEKVHVTTDQSRYVAGDTVWLRAWVVDAATHAQVSASRYVYVELADPSGSVVDRVKLREQGGRFPGHLPLEPDLAGGDYTLTAYTSFMEGPGAGYFFRKRLGVVSAYAGIATPEVSFSHDPDGGRTAMTAGLRDSDGRLHWYESMSVTSKDGRVREWRRSDRPRSVTLSDEDLGAGSVLVSLDNYRMFVPLPSPSSGFDVTFHPEGGGLVGGAGCRVGIKAVDSSGRGIDVDGVLVDSSGSVVDTFRTVHRGMGELSFVPVEGMSYRAFVRGKEFPFPEVLAGTCALHVDNSRSSAVTVTAVGGVPPGSVLAVQNRGRAVYAGAVVGGLPVRIPREYIGEGIVQFLLVDGMGMPLSERLAFNRGPEVPSPRASVLDSCGSRSLVIEFPAGLMGSDVSVAVLDGGVAEPDTTVTIQSQLLLQGDLRGHVEDAGWYFRHRGRHVDMSLDALMLTQGWRRYDVAGVLSGRYSEPMSAIEAGPEITGVVRSRWRGKPMEGATVNVLAPSIDYAGVASTDRDGRFTVSDLDFPEGTKFVVQALNPKGGNEHNFEIDEQEFPPSDALVPDPAWPGLVDGPESSDGVDYAWRVGHINGQMSVTLGEITVRRHKRQDPEDIYEILASKTFTSDQLENDHITSYEEALRKIPGLTIMGGNVIYRNSSVSFFVDGVPFLSGIGGGSSGGSAANAQLSQKMDDRLNGSSFNKPHISSFAYSELDRISSSSYGSNGFFSQFTSMYPIQNVKKLQFFKPNEAFIFGGNSITKGGVIMVTMKDGSEWKTAPSIFLRTIMPLGYQKPAEFYVPKYDYNEPITNTGSTLYWLPAYQVADSIMSLELPNIINCKLVIEGISADGNPIRLDTPLK